MQNNNINNLSTTQFIDLIKRFGPIYDTSSPEYKNMEKKLQCWQSISDEVGLPIDACKRKWKNLRDSYTKFLRSFRYDNYSTRKYQYWAHAEQMEFLRPFQGAIRSHKEADTNSELKKYLINNKDEVKNEPYQEEFPTAHPALIEEYSQQLPHNQFLSYMEQPNPLDYEVDPTKLNKNNNNKHSDSNSNNYSNGVNNSPKSNLQITNIRSTNKLSRRKISKNSTVSSLSTIKLITELDATSLFFLSLAKSVNSMPKIFQSNIKMQCMKLVVDTETELESLREFNNQSNEEHHRESYNDKPDSQGEGEQFLYVMSPKTLIDISSDDDNM